MPRRAPAGRRDLGEVRALQRSRPGGFRIAALLRPPAPEAGEPEDVWLDRAAVARKQGAFGHHTHFGGVDRARPPVPELACDRLRREATWLSERGMGPRFWCGGGWYFTPAIAGVLSDLGYADCTATAFRLDYLASGAPHLKVDEPCWLLLEDGRRLLELPATHSLRMARPEDFEWLPGALEAATPVLNASLWTM